MRITCPIGFFNLNLFQGGSQKSNNSALGNDPDIFYSWNNNDVIVHMMQHSYKHRKQLTKPKMNLKSILNGPRDLFKPAAEHELDCRFLRIYLLTYSILKLNKAKLFFV